MIANENTEERNSNNHNGSSFDEEPSTPASELLELLLSSGAKDSSSEAPVNGEEVDSQRSHQESNKRQKRSSTIEVITRTEETDGADIRYISALSKEERSKIRKSDPFLYYSIPEHRWAYYMLEDDDDSDDENDLPLGLGVQDRNGVQPVRGQWQLRNYNSSETKITRRTCISTEAHPTMLLDDIFDDMHLDE